MSDSDQLRAKATAILLANRAKSAGDVSEARKQFARAAELEELVFRQLASKGRPDFLVNAISAVSCWIEAKRFEPALRASGEALALAKAMDVDRDLVSELSQLADRAAERDTEDWVTEHKPARSSTPQKVIELGDEHRGLLEDFRRRLEAAEPIPA